MSNDANWIQLQNDIARYHAPLSEASTTVVDEKVSN